MQRTLLYNLLILCLLLCGGEIALRAFGYGVYDASEKAQIAVVPNGSFMQKDSLLGYTHQSGDYSVTLGEDFEFKVGHLDNTLRRTSNSEIDFKNLPEIWLAGCSFTHGWTVNDEETFAWRLQENFSKFKVVNFGVSGYGTYQCYLQLKRALAEGYSPKYIVLNHADFHLERNTYSFKYRRATSDWSALGKVKRPVVSLAENNNLKVRYEENIYKPWLLAPFSALVYKAELVVERLKDKIHRGEDERVLKLLLGKMSDLCAENQIEFIIANIDVEDQLIKSHCKSEGLNYFDISVDYKDKQFNNMPLDGHPNAKAHAAYAKELTAQLEKLILEKVNSSPLSQKEILFKDF